MKRITYFNYLYDLYGISLGSTIKAVEMFRALEQMGYQVGIHWRKAGESDNTSQFQVRRMLKPVLARYLHEPNQLLRNIRYARDEHRILCREKPDMMIARLETNVFSPLLQASHLRVPFIAEVDSPVTYEIRHYTQHYYLPYRLLERMEMEFIMRAEMAYCVSNQLKQYFVKRGVPEWKLRVISNGADTRRFNPHVSGQTVIEKHLLKGNTVIGFVGSFHYWHGVYHLIELMDEMIRHYPKVVFLLVGEGGPLKNELYRYVAEKSLENQVVLTGLVDHEQIPAYINAMDIVLAPYPPLEFFYYSPVKIYEYMACGRAVVSTEIGQIGELITHGKNGMLCTPGRTDEMFQILKQLMENVSLRRQIGRNAARLVASQHTWRHKAKQLSDLIEKVTDAYSV